ncbi:MAG TPA: hypothetical protein VN623_13355, partial [Hyphomicrobium sp.]|uniref:hypothetical protein n=1 Tax=Hyphomicrobium sp. TaxID=82 RepID=UPI002B9C19A8
MSNVRNLLLACSALAPIALATPAHAALDSGLRGAILSDQPDAPRTAKKHFKTNDDVAGLAFAAARSELDYNVARNEGPVVQARPDASKKKNR